MKLVYVAGPYTASHLPIQKDNIKAADEWGRQVALAGFAPLIPHKNTSLWDLDVRFKHWTHKDYMERICLPLLTACDIILFTGCWEQSTGCLIEHEEAERLGKIRVYSIDELRKAAA